jgi:hypothetical protein
VKRSKNDTVKIFVYIDKLKNLTHCIGVRDGIYRRSLINKHKITFAEGFYYEDQLFSIQTAYYAKKVVYIKTTFYHYTWNALGISGALAGFYSKVPVFHVEDGLSSGDLYEPYYGYCGLRALRFGGH